MLQPHAMEARSVRHHLSSRWRYLSPSFAIFWLIDVKLRVEVTFPLLPICCHENTSNFESGCLSV